MFALTHPLACSINRLGFDIVGLSLIADMDDSTR
jgi:hypothetical protein